jgi:peptide-methionine (S)-S-oxide reductase
MATIIGTAGMACGIAHAEVKLPDPAQDMPLAKTKTEQQITVAGGCFWGVQAVFQHVKGVESAISGYAGGTEDSAHYDMVSRGTTGHAESVQVTYDASQVSLGQILKVFFAVAHNPTELDRQGPDHGTQYRSAVFYNNADQQKIADAYIAQLNDANSFGDKIVTQVVALQKFYPAESYHQDYARLHPYNAYIAINDLPKVAALEKQFPQLYVKP